MHKELAETNGFTIVCDLKDHVNEGIKRTQLSRRWKNISDDDLTCIESFMQARKM